MELFNHENITTLISSSKEFIKSNAGLIGAIASFVSILLAIFFAVRGKQKQKILFFIEETTVIASFISEYHDIKILHNEKEIENMHVARVYIWNAGNKVINHNDIASKEPISIKLKDNMRLLNSQIISFSSSVNNLEICNIENEISVKFDYLAKNDGVVIQVLYSFDSGEKTNARGLSVVGIVKEQGKVKEALILDTPDKSNNTVKRNSLYGGFISLLSKRTSIVIFDILFISLFISTLYSNLTFPERLFNIILFGLAILIFTMIAFSIKSIPKKIKTMQSLSNDERKNRTSE
ncbi:MAG: hypothetical protein FWD44_09090 [Oscillospiraceae bacterium]|nr:hypothetical protein [Oscillospiraceae bacterium]